MISLLAKVGCPAAVPPDVRKVSDLPATPVYPFGAAPWRWGAAPKNLGGSLAAGQSRRRTSGGTAASRYFCQRSIVLEDGQVSASMRQRYRVALVALNAL